MSLSIQEMHVWVEVFEAWMGTHGYEFATAPAIDLPRTFMDFKKHHPHIYKLFVYVDLDGFALFISLAAGDIKIPITIHPSDPMFDPDKFFEPFVKYLG